MKKCSAPECDRKHYAKGLCGPHYARVSKSLTPIRPWRRPHQCSFPGCTKKYYCHGFCLHHYLKHKKGMPLDSPRLKSGARNGALNPNWKGGISEYQNHSEMKRMRNIVLEEENYTCHYCGKPTNKIHHKDLSKNNHKRENLTACCHRCNLKFQGPRKSKYTKLYGKTLTEISRLLSMSIPWVWKLHKIGKLSDLLPIRPPVPSQ